MITRNQHRYTPPPRYTGTLTHHTKSGTSACIPSQPDTQPLPLWPTAWCIWHQQESRHWRATPAVGMEGSGFIWGFPLAIFQVCIACWASGTVYTASGPVSPEAGSCSGLGLPPTLRLQAHQGTSGLGWARIEPTQLCTLCPGGCRGRGAHFAHRNFMVGVTRLRPG